MVGGSKLFVWEIWGIAWGVIAVLRDAKVLSEEEKAAKIAYSIFDDANR